MGMSLGTLMAFVAGLLTPVFWVFTYRTAAHGRTSDFFAAIFLVSVITFAVYESPPRDPVFFLGIGVGVAVIWLMGVGGRRWGF